MNILTFDIEEWFHCDMTYANRNWDEYEVRIYESTDRILNVLEQRGLKATFFCMGWMVRKHPELILKIKGKGHEIGCHSDMHELVTSFKVHEFRKDTEMAIKSIEDVIGSKVIIYRAPAFSITENNLWVFEVLIENGIEIDCSVFPAAHDFGGFPSFGSSLPALVKIKGTQIKEFPMNTTKFLGYYVVFSGGGFFRLLPYKIIRQLMRKSSYVMTYFHPRDFDANQPRLRYLSANRYFKSYVGLKGSFLKFEKLINEFDFMCVSNASAKIDWETTRVLDLSLPLN